ncbi:MAG TPA: hypothetical protein VGO11_06875 [Chthoniobacteraceae bacterium]|jgi:hypothetical protein|nr:hypothetical protein [Chthoniobacteraceae bacterium]
MRTVHEARPSHTLAATDWRHWSMASTSDRVVKVRGRIDWISRKTGDFTIGQDDQSFFAVNCSLARGQDQLWPLQVGSVVTLKGLLLQGSVPSRDQAGGLPLYACVILRVEPTHSTTNVADPRDLDHNPKGRTAGSTNRALRESR